MTLNVSLLREQPAITLANAVVVALSGGVDSVVLLHLAVRALHAGDISSLRAIHIHHQLNEQADSWANFCQQLCKDYAIPCLIRKVNLENIAKNGIEKAARDSRYHVFENHLKTNECLLMGHHQDDQAETALFRTLRGSDPYGLSSIPQQRNVGKGYLFRPFLSVTRQDIKEYAHACSLKWVEDSSNDQDVFDRNYLRHRVIPLLKARWPQISKTLAETASQCQSSQRLLEEIAIDDLRLAGKKVSFPFMGEVLAINCLKLSTLSDDRQQNLLKQWLRKHYQVTPGKTAVQQMLHAVKNAEADKLPCLKIHHLYLRCFQQWLFVDPLKSLPVIEPLLLNFCDDSSPICFEGGQLEYVLSEQSPGITTKLTTAEITSRPYIKKIRPFAIKNRKGRKSLKKWLNELKVPPWLRDHIPLLIKDDELLAIPGLLTNVIFSAKTCDKSWSLSWRFTTKSTQ